jgi:hypothetical protein
MKTVKPNKDAEEKDWATPGVKLTHEEFVAGIHKAEEGPFYSLEEVQIIRKQWREKKKDL